VYVLQRISPLCVLRLLCLLLLGSAVCAADVKIDHDPVERARSGVRIALEAGMKGERIDQVRTYFRADTDGRWHFVPMDKARGVYTGILPAADVHTEFVRYQLLAITPDRELFKSDVYTIEIEADEEALARLNRKAPTDVKVDVSELQDAQDLYEELKSSERVQPGDRTNLADSAGEPDPSSRVETRSEYSPRGDTLNGFSDYINLTYVADAQAFGVGAGAAAAGAGGGGGDDDGAASPPAGGGVTDFSGRWTGPQSCNATGDAAFRWVVDLSQSDDQVNGIVAFHDCPGGGRARYEVSGTATSAASLEADGTLVSSAGPLAGTAPANQTFTLREGEPPDPNFAP